MLGNLGGQLASINCRHTPPIGDAGLFYARQSGLFDQLTGRAGQPGQAPIPINVGDSTFPGALARYLLASQEGARDFASTLDDIPFAAHAMGNAELGMERTQLLNFIDGANNVNLPVQAANIVCNEKDGAEAICEGLGGGANRTPWTVVEKNGLDVGIISVIDPQVTSAIANSRADGFEVADPEDILAELVETARDQGQADLIVVLYHMVGDPDHDHPADLAAAVDGIDLLFTNRLFNTTDPTESADSTDHHGFLTAPSTGAYVVGAHTGPRSAVTAQVDLAKDEPGGRWRVTHLSAQTRQTDGVAPREGTAKKLRDLAGLYCQDWGKPMNPDLGVTHPFSRRDLQTFILNAMRFSTDAEVALVNSGAFVNNGGFPIDDTLTLADIFTFAPYNNRLFTVDVPGNILQAVADKLGDTLVAAGMSNQNDTPTVNGRPINTDRSYRMATNDYLVGGGNEALPADTLSNIHLFNPEWAAESTSVGTLAAELVRTADFAKDAALTDQLDPGGNFPDLHRNFLWRYTGSINASFNKVSVDNPRPDGQPGYQQSQLNVNSTTQINLEGNASIHADSRNHGWDNRLLVQYAQARVTADDDTVPDFEETKDLIRYRSTYQYSGLRANAGGGWYVPMPFTELQVETEFTDPNERSWHKLELTGIGGAKFQLFGPLNLKVGANARRDINQPKAATTYGLNAGYTFERTSLFDVLGTPIQFESELEYFYNDISRSNIQEIRNTNRLYFAVIEQLFFTTTFQAFLYRNDQVGEFGSNTELTVGLNYLWDSTVQSF